MDEPGAIPDPPKRDDASEPSLQGWLQAAFSGSSRDAAELIEAHRKYLLFVANHELDARLQGKVAASDAVQETFTLAQEKFATFRGTSEAELQAWLRQILLNHLGDLRRHFAESDKRRVARERPTAADSRVGRMSIDLASTAATPRTDAMEREEAEALRLAVERLPEDYRQVIMLRSWERLGFDEVGRRMGRSAEAVRKLWARAVEFLQGELGNLDGN